MAIISKSIPPQRPMLPQSTLSHFLSYVRTSGIVSLMLGGASMMNGPEYFWVAVALVNLGLFLLAVDIFSERWSIASVRWIFISVVAIFAVAFNWAWVLTDYPLEFTSVAIDSEHQEGTSIAGISWHPKFTELQVFITNPSKSNYSDIDVIVRPDMPVAKVAQRTDFQGVSLQDRHGATTNLIRVNGHEKATVPLTLLAIDAGYRVRVEKLLAKTSIHLTFAVVNIRSAKKPASPSEAFTEKHQLIMNYEDGTHYWYGLDGTDAYADRELPKMVKIDGEYTAGQRKRSVSLQIVPRH